MPAVYRHELRPIRKGRKQIPVGTAQPSLPTQVLNLFKQGIPALLIKVRGDLIQQQDWRRPSSPSLSSRVSQDN